MIRAVGRWVAIVALGATGVLGLFTGVDDLPGATNLFQGAVSVGVLLYGVLGIAAAILVYRRRRAGSALAALWAADVTFVGTGAVIAYGDQPPLSAATLSAFAGCVLIGGFVWWLAHRAVEQAPAPAAQTAR